MNVERADVARGGRAAATLAGLSIVVGTLWYWYLTVPVVPAFGITGMRVAGLTCAVALGGLCRPVVPSFIIAVGAAVAGLTGGAAYADWGLSDVSKTAWEALLGGIRLMSMYGVHILVAFVVGWVVLDRIYASQVRRAGERSLR